MSPTPIKQATAQIPSNNVKGSPKTIAAKIAVKAGPKKNTTKSGQLEMY